jgi:hypothetical protein
MAVALARDAARAVWGRDRQFGCGTWRTGARWTLEGHEWSPHRRLAGRLTAASASWDGTVRLLDLARGTPTRVLEGHEANVAAVRFSPDGRAIASAGWDGAVRIWHAESGEALSALLGHEGNVTAVAFHPTGRQVASGGEDRTLRLWDPRARRGMRVLAGHDAEITAVVFSPDGRFLFSSSRDQSVRVWDARRGVAVRSLPHPAAVMDLAPLPLGSRLISAGADRVARLWHLDWEPDSAEAAASHETARPFLETLARPAAIPRAAVAVRRIPWGRLAAAAAVVAAFAVGFVSWYEPKPKVRLSPYAAKVIRSEVDLVDVARFTDGCSPGDTEAHFERLVSGNAEAHDVACLAATGSEATATAVLEGAPLVDPDPMRARRLRRNAASVLVGLGPAAVDALCPRLGDPREEVRGLAEISLGVVDAPEAVACARQELATGTPDGRAAAAADPRRQIGRGRVGAEEAWSIVTGLLGDADPSRRIAGLGLLPLFAADVSEPAARPLAEDPDPGVAGAARNALGAIEKLRRVDALGEIGS